MRRLPYQVLRILLFVMLTGGGAFAQDGYPSKPVRMIVPYPPGGVGDTTARMLAPKWIEQLGQQLVIENRPGAASNIGADAVAKAAPDGYTIGFFDSAFVVNPSLYARLPFDPIADFVPIMVVARGPMVLVVNPNTPAGSVGELIAMAKAKPGAMSYASAGSGTAIHLAAELLKTATGTQIVHVPYKGAGPAVLGVVAGEVPMMFGLPGTVRGQISGGKLRALAITGERRFAGMPNVPTFVEAGFKGVDASLILIMAAPAKTPRPIIDKLYETLHKTVTAPETRDKLLDVALVVIGADPQQSAKLLQDERELWARVVKASGAKVE